MSQMGETTNNPFINDMRVLKQKRSSGNLIKYTTTERSSIKFIPEMTQEVTLDVEESKKISPVSLPKDDPFPVFTGHNFLNENSFEQRDSFEKGEELIGYGYQCPKLFWQLNHIKKNTKKSNGKIYCFINRQ